MKKQRKTLTRDMLERIIIIHNTIKSGCYPNSEELAEKVERSVPTISLDISFLRDRFDAPIEYDAYNRGFYYTKPFELPVNELSLADMEILTSAKILLSHFEGTPLYDKLYTLIDFLAPNDKGKTPMINRIAVTPVAKSFYDKTIWKDIYEAMKTNQIIEFDYNGLLRAELTHRRVHPYQLVMNDGLVYLLGYSEERQADRIFSLTRMSNMVITKDQFTLPKDYDFSKKCNDGKFGFFFHENKSKVRLRFYYELRQVVQERLWADDQVFEDHGDYVDLIFTSNQHNKILDWILSLGAAAEPIEPEWLVQKWKDSLTESAQLAGIL